MFGRFENCYRRNEYYYSSFGYDNNKAEHRWYEIDGERVIVTPFDEHFIDNATISAQEYRRKYELDRLFQLLRLP